MRGVAWTSTRSFSRSVAIAVNTTSKFLMSARIISMSTVEDRALGFALLLVHFVSETAPARSWRRRRSPAVGFLPSGHRFFFRTNWPSFARRASSLVLQGP